MCLSRFQCVIYDAVLRISCDIRQHQLLNFYGLCLLLFVSVCTSSTFEQRLRADKTVNVRSILFIPHSYRKLSTLYSGRINPIERCTPSQLPTATLLHFRMRTLAKRKNLSICFGTKKYCYSPMLWELLEVFSAVDLSNTEKIDVKQSQLRHSTWCRMCESEWFFLISLGNNYRNENTRSPYSIRVYRKRQIDEQLRFDAMRFMNLLAVTIDFQRVKSFHEHNMQSSASKWKHWFPFEVWIAVPACAYSVGNCAHQ